MHSPDRRLVKRRGLSAGLLAALVLPLLPLAPALAQAPTPPALAAPDAAAVDPPFGAWVAKSLGGADIPPDGGITLEIRADGSVLAHDGCNSLRGAGVVAGPAAAGDGGLLSGTLVFPPLASTRMACPGHEPRLGDALQATRGFQVGADGVMALTGEDGDVFARFAPDVALPSPLR